MSESGLRGVGSRRGGTLPVMLIAVGIAVLGFILLGLPGILILEAATVFAGLVSTVRLGGDEFWPAALTISALGPFTLVPAHLVLRRACLRRWPHAVLTAALALTLTFVASVVGIVLSGQ